MRAALAQPEAPAAKTASDYFLQYHNMMSAAKSIDDLRPFMDADQQKEMDAAPKAEQETGVKMISGMYADVTDVKVVKETAKGNAYIDSEVWKFGGSTMTLKKKEP